MKRGQRRKALSMRKGIQKNSTKKKVLKESFRGIDNTRDIDLILENNKLYQEMLGFSKENIFPMYEQAVGFLQTHRNEEAIAAFSFLTKINPYVADFWLGLAIAYMSNDSYKLAIESFIMAMSLDPLRSDIYEYAVDCCLTAGDLSQAKNFARHAMIYAKRHHFKEMQEEVRKLEEKIALKTPD